MSGFVVWFTGLSGSGKSTLATLLAQHLSERGVHAEILDGDEIRRNLSKGLGFSKEDRCENLRRLGFVAGVVARTGACAIAAAISPYREVRDQLRGENPRFCEVYCECPISVLTQRDPKGLYEKALRGEIKNFTGIDDPYEEPLTPEVRVHTDRETPAQSTERIVARLEELGYLARAGSSSSLRARVQVVHQVLQDGAAQAARAEAEQLPSLRLSSAQAALADALALGMLSPLGGFMTARERHCVEREARLEGGQPFPEPILLEARSDEVLELGAAKRIALRRGEGTPFALLDVEEIWQAAAAPAEVRCVSGTVKTFDAMPGLQSARHVRSQLELRAARSVLTVNGKALAAAQLQSTLQAALRFHDLVLLLEPSTSDLTKLPAELAERTLQLPVPEALLGPLVTTVARSYGSSHWLRPRAAGAVSTLTQHELVAL